MVLLMFFGSVNGMDTVILPRFTSEAAPRTDEACSALLPGASLPGASYLSQPRTFTQETTFGNFAQQAARFARGAV